MLGGGGSATLRGEAAFDLGQEPSSNVHAPFYRRLSLSLRALAAARLVVIAAFGAHKAAAVAAAVDPTSPLPVALLVRAARRSLLLLDPEAAAELPTQG